MSSKRGVKRRECGRKFAHATRGEAVFVCLKMLRKRGTLLHPYLCRHCGRWHIGHWKGSGVPWREATPAARR